MPESERYETVFISDVHLGTPDSKAEEATQFLAGLSCKTLILNGDIIDEWSLSRGGKWRPSHSQFIQEVFAKLQDGTRVIYIRGNHDNVLEHLLPLEYANLSFVDRHIHQTPQGPYLVIHGDGLDTNAVGSGLLTICGSVTYEVILRVNRILNRFRAFFGLPYFSLGGWIKKHFKKHTPFLKHYKAKLEEIARTHECRGIIVGHIHTPDDCDLNGVHYLNSGDWMESKSAIVEREPGQFSLVYFDQQSQDHAAGTEPAANPEESDSAHLRTG